ncbi:biosynthetic arginine decarboxylase [Suttonella ornithocola]|uniref:Biosynthetic arginine decarboxylase n=1 Tax=Suttonella ornithocola TaxID=279832 RepID=A0A380MWK5_9GAMM|nr:biosynthetic arginine decarboxylase [Suttonella ornithocola]SUO96955.1 Biosynthetic arginine decarboxylase [Suttonella ornithocola]
MSEQEWTRDDAEALYKVNGWGAGYFGINSSGNIVVNVPNAPNTAIPLVDLIDGMRARGKEMPVLLRVQNLLENQIKLINEEFAKAIADSNYQGQYRGVFPIKVNQQAQVIEDIVRFGKPYSHGLEAGSKAELMIALSMLREPGPLIVCNGYKDREFVELGLGMLKLGFKVIFVIETPAELPIIVESSKAMGIRPMIGVRAKLFSHVSGHWNLTSGDKSMFGLNAAQLVDVIDGLKAAEMLDCLQFLHYHLGSQIPNIRDIRTGVREACRYYVELVEEGAPMQYLDLGGGLAVDYDGSRSSAIHSRNYSLEEYCVDVVETIQSVLDEKNIPHPTIVTESGRATVAYSSVLLFDILDVTGFSDAQMPARRENEENAMIQNLHYAYETLTPKTAQESFNDAVYYRDEARDAFMRGHLSLRTRSEVEQIFMSIMAEVAKIAESHPDALSEPELLKTMLADIYYGNFSVFQSLPDAWAIDQIFPVVPLHRLNERPTRNTIVADMTCDSDGKIDRFVEDGEIQRVLPLHEIKLNEPYYLGAFLVGAYQETLGDLHNLLGDTHVVSVYIHEDGSFDFVNEVEGDSVADVLSYVEYQPQNLLAHFRETAERAVRKGTITPAERQRLVNMFEAGLRGYTYYEQ